MAFKDLPDSVLLQRWKDGDKQVFNTLFDRHFNKLLQYTTNRISDTELAEEIVMDIMMRLWQKHTMLQVDSSLSPWLFRAIKNSIIDHKRKKALQTIGIEETDFEHPRTASLEDQYNTSELQQIYHKSLKLLSPQRRKVFELSRQHGKSIKEISEETNLSVSTVKQHIGASLHTLRYIMQPHTDLVYGFIAVFSLFL